MRRVSARLVAAQIAALSGLHDRARDLAPTDV
jgi:hypothetical protein